MKFIYIQLKRTEITLGFSAHDSNPKPRSNTEACFAQLSWAKSSVKSFFQKVEIHLTQEE